MEPASIIKAAGAARAALGGGSGEKNHTGTILGCLAGLLVLPGCIVTGLLSCFSGSTMDGDFDPASTEGYAVCQEIREDYLEWLEEAMDEREEQIIQDNTYRVTWPIMGYVDGRLVEVDEGEDWRCDISVRRIVNELSLAYLMSFISTAEPLKSGSLSDQIDRDEVLEFMKRAGPVRQSLVVENVVTIFNLVPGIDDAAAWCFPEDTGKQEMMKMSFELYVSFLGSGGLTRVPVEGYDWMGDREPGEPLVHTGGLPVPHYFQTDYVFDRYGTGTIATSGCAPTCIAMAASCISGGNVTPVDVARVAGDRYYVPGSGSSWGIFAGTAPVWGMGCSSLGKSRESVRQELLAGHPVIASMGPGTFTRGGHFIVLRGITGEGKFLVNDPNRKNYEGYGTDEFSMELVFREAKNFWSFYRK